jgi:hypothetical protein
MLLLLILHYCVFIQRRVRYRLIGLREISPRLRDEDENFVFVWLILYMLRFWGTLRFLMAVSRRPHPYTYAMFKADEFLRVPQCIGDSGQAFWNCVLFCFCDKTVRARIMEFCCSCLPHYRQRQGQEERQHLLNAST